MRLVMFGTGPFALPTFRALYGTRHTVVALVTQPPRVVRGKVVAAPSLMRTVAAEHGTPIFDPLDVNDAASRARLAEFASDLFVVADYGQILSPDTLGLAQHGAVNLHGSLLPKYRGAAPINWALYHGERETGVSVIGMTPRVDAGPVLAQATTVIDPDESAEQLEHRLAELGAPVIARMLDAVEQGTAAPLVQDPALATRARRLRKTDGAIDWSRSAAELKNQVRAFEPWPTSFTYWLRGSVESLRLILRRVNVASEDALPEIAAAQPGEVLVASGEQLIVATGQGALQIEELQPAGRHAMTAAEFLRGHPIGPGVRLGPTQEEPV